MKEIKIIHVLVGLALGLLLLAVFQWAQLPKKAPQTVIDAPKEVAQTKELPKLHQNEIYRLNAPPSFAAQNPAEELPPFDDSSPSNELAPKDPAVSKKAAL